MTTKKPPSPFFAGTFSSNGDSSSAEEEDDDVFLNSRLDVISRTCDEMDDDGLEYYENPNSSCLLNFKKNANSESSLFTPSPKPEDHAVIFSVHLYGKYYGDVGLFEPDISVLDWREFKVYIFSGLNLDSFYSYIITYYDEEGYKSLLESQENYQEILKIAKYKARAEEKLSLYITRTGGGLTNSIKSLVSSSLRRVNSVGGSKTSVTTTQPAKKDVTTSTSFQNIGQLHCKSMDLNNEELSSSSFVPSPHLDELSSPQENYFGDNYQSYDKNFYGCKKHCIAKETIPPFPPITNRNWNAPLGRQDSENSLEVPSWFSSYMKQFKEDLSLEVSSKIEERFDEAVGNLSATDVEAKLRGLLTGYSSELQNKVLCCCKSPNGHCQKSESVNQSMVFNNICRQETIERQLVTPQSVTKFDQREDSIEGEGVNNQIYFLEKLLRREEEILDFLDSTNEKIKQRMRSNSDYNYVFEGSEILRRIESLQHRQNRTTNDIRMLQQKMEVNNEGIARLAYVQELISSRELDIKNLKEGIAAEVLSNRPKPYPFKNNSPPKPMEKDICKKDYDATFVKDENLIDGSLVEPGQKFTKRWTVKNSGFKVWDKDTYLICNSNNLLSRIKPTRQSIPCPPLSPGEEGTISADFTAPSFPGTFTSQWRFMHGQDLFGDHLWCQLKVTVTTNIFDTDKPPSLTSIHPQSLSLQELTKEPTFNIPLDLIPRMFDKTSIEYFCYMNKDNLARLSSEEILYYLLYIVRIVKPDLTSLPDRRPLDFLCKYLSRGADTDFDHLSSFMDKHFFENCFKDSFKEKEIIQCYEELFTTKDSDTLLSRIKQFQNRFINNSCSYSAVSSDTEEDEEVKEEDLEEEEDNEVDQEANNDILESGRETAPLIDEENEHNKDYSLNPEELIIENNIIPTPSDFSDVDNRDYESEYDQLDEVLENEIVKQELLVEQLNLENIDIEHINHISVPELQNHLPDELESLPDTEDERHSEKVESENEQACGKDVDSSSCKESDSEPVSDTDSCVGSDENDDDDDNDGDDDHHNDEDEGIEGDENELDNDVDHIDYHVNDSDEEFNNDEEVEQDTSDNNDEDDDNDDDANGEIDVNESDIEENHQPKNSTKTSNENLPTSDTISNIQDDKSRIESDPAIDPSASNKMKIPEGASSIHETTMKKNITTLRENFSQNVEVQLDFEVISRAPKQEETRGNSLHSEVSDPLTFQEKHFTVSTRLPPDPVHVPDSDDESFDGLVFIKDSDIPSSVPPTEPGSPSNPPPLSKPPELNESFSCSSFSEFDEDEVDEEAPQGRPENPESSSMLDSLNKLLGLS